MIEWYDHGRIWTMQFVMSLIGADILDEHGRIIMVNSRTCNTNNEIYYRYNCVVHVTYAYL
jgi:hypothetical protein